MSGRYPPLQQGAYEATCRDHVGWLCRRGDRVTVLTSISGLPTRRATEERGPAGELVLRELAVSPDDRAPSGRALWKREISHRRALDRALTRTSPDAVVFWSMSGISKSLLTLVQESGRPAMVVIQDAWPAWDIDDDGWSRYWSRRPSRMVSRVAKPVVRALVHRAVSPWDLAGALSRIVPVYCSDALREDVEARRPELCGHGVVVHGGIDEVAATRARSDGEPLNRPVRLLCAGSVEKGQGTHTAIASLARLRADGLDARLRIAGRPDAVYQAELRDQAVRQGVDDLLDWQDAPDPGTTADLFRSADILLYPTLWREPFGLVPLEAMATGCVVVATGAGGCAEYLSDGVNALVVGVNDDRAAARAVRRLLDDEKLVSRLRRAGRETVSRHTTGALNTGLDATLDRLLPARGDAS